jgi:hypothetical protein
MQPDFFDKLILTVVDKGLLVILALIVGLWVNRVLETFKTQQATLLETFRGQQALSLEAFKSQRSFENELARLRDAKHIDFLEKQLSQFYWPIYMRLEIDSAVWEKILDRRNGEDEVRRKIGAEIEKTFILPNHEEIVRLMESNIHLAVPDPKTLQAMLQYIRHVAVYKAMRAAGCDDKDPIHLGEPWPDSLFPLIKKTVDDLQGQYDRLIGPAKLQASSPPSGAAPTDKAEALRRLRELATNYSAIKARGFSKGVNALNETADGLWDFAVENGITKDVLADESDREPNDGMIVALATAVKSQPEDGDVERLLRVAGKTTKRHARYRIVQAFGELFRFKMATPEARDRINEILDVYQESDLDEPLHKQINACRDTMRGAIARGN